MRSDPENDIQRLWRAQAGDPQRPSVEEIREKALRFDAKTRRWQSVGAATMIVLVITNAMEVFWPGQGIVERTGDLLTLAALLYISYEYHAYARVAPRPERLGFTTCVDFYRAQLVRERNLARRGTRYLLPFVPGVTLSSLGGVLDSSASNARRLTIAALGIALFLGVAWLNAHTARKLQREIDTLDGL